MEETVAGPDLCFCWRWCPAPSQPFLLRDAALLAIFLGHGLAPKQGLLHREDFFPHLHGLLSLQDLSRLPGLYWHRGRGQRQAATPPTSVAPSFHMLLLHSCAGGRASPCAGPSCHSICQQHPRVAPALVLSQPGSPRTAPTPPALQSHSPCSVALCCWHIPSCAPGGTPTRCWKRVLSRLTCLCTRRLGSRGKEGQRRQQVRGERSCPAGSSQVRAGAGAAAPQVLQLPLCLLPLPGWRGWGPQWGSQAGPTGH